MMKILFVANWRVKTYKEKPKNVQPSNYCVEDESYWFFKYFKTSVKVDVLGIQNRRILQKIEKKIHFHLFQTFKVLKLVKKNNYDLIFVHGTDSAIFLCFLKRLFRLKIPPIVVVDISSFFHATRKGFVYRICRFASEAINHLIYHCSYQKEYFDSCFPKLKDKMTFIPFGVDCELWNVQDEVNEDYFVCAGYRKRDWNTLIKGFKNINSKIELILIGKTMEVDDSRVKCLPIVNIDKYNELIRKALFSVIPLEDMNYSFGQMTLLQQLAAGKIIIVSDSHAVRDYIKEGIGIFVYKSGDENDLELKIHHVLSLDLKEIKVLGKDNYQYVKKYFSEDKMAKSIENVCIKIIGEGGDKNE